MLKIAVENTLSRVYRGARKPFLVIGSRGSLKALLVVVQGEKTLVSMKWRYPNGGRLVSRIEAGNTKGQARPFVRGQAATGLCASKPHRVGRWGLGRAKSPLLVQQGSMPLMRQLPRGMQREKCRMKCKTVSLAKMCGRTSRRFCTTHTSCSQCNDGF